MFRAWLKFDEKNEEIKIALFKTDCLFAIRFYKFIGFLKT
jgi:hypothetical protein